MIQRTKNVCVCVLFVLSLAAGFGPARNTDHQASAAPADNSAAILGPRSLGARIGCDVHDNFDVKVGVIQDIVLDDRVLSVSYAAVQYQTSKGERKLFAVPWDTLEFRAGAPGRVCLSVPEQVLKDSRGFDEKRWPNAGDPIFRRIEFIASADVETDVAVKDANGPHSGPVVDGLVWTRRVSAMIGAKVVYVDNQNVGRVSDLVTENLRANIKHARLIVSGSPRVGEATVDVPITSLASKRMTKELVLESKIEPPPGK